MSSLLQDPGWKSRSFQDIDFLLSKDRQGPTGWQLKILLERSTSLPFTGQRKSHVQAWCQWVQDTSPRRAGKGSVGSANILAIIQESLTSLFLPDFICNLSEHPVGSVFKIHPEYHFFTTFPATSLFHYITICLEYCSSPRLAFVLLPLSPYCLFLTQHMDNSAKKDSNHVILQLKTLW